MEKIVRLVLDRASNGMMDKQTAAQILSLLKTEEIKPRQEIAVIGVAAHLPRVDNLDQFWEAVMNQVDFIGDVPDQRKADLDDYLAYADHIFGDQMKYLSGAYLEDIDKFDPQLFRLSPREASLMDPHQRLFLQVAWRVIEDAGYAGGKISGSKTGVYVGFASNAKDNYQKMIFDVDSGLMSSAGVGNVTAMLPSRISYLLDLKGPSMVIDTACSSALIAVHTACQAIRNGDCEMAIAGSVRMNLLPVDQDFLKFGLESSDGKTRTFDDKSDGAGMGEGVIAVLLKPLDKAVRDKDHIYAVIKGNAVNQDGTSIGLTAPNPEAQKDVILKAWDHAGIHPETLSYIESHGTGTVLGDPIELDGLERAFREHTDKKQFCAIGSLKTNLGHLFESAGLAGFVKCMLMFKHRKIPPMLFFERPNARVDFSQLPVYVNNKPSEWRASGSGTPLRCGISSFGFSGTNCHMVLEEPPTPQEEAAENIGPFLCVLSAKTQSALMRSVHNLLAHLERHHPAIQDVGYTLATGRNHFNCRLALIAVDTAELVSQLRGIAVSGFASSRLEGVQWGEYKVVPSNKANLAETEMYEKDQRVLTESATLVTDSVSPGLRLPLERISELYVRGADIPWELVYRFSGARKVSLPGYAFERNRCWLDIPKGVGKAAANRVESGGEDRFYALKWESLPFVTADEPSLSEGVALVLSDGNPMSGLLASRFRERGMDVLEAEFGDRFEQKTEWHYVIRGDEEEFIRLLEPHASKLRRVVQAIGFGASPDSLEELERIQHIGTYSLFQLARAVAKLEIAQEMDIVLLTETAVKVTGEEACIRPEQATLAGLGKVVRKEHANLICRNVDIDPDTPAVRIAEEIDCMQQEIYRIAYRLGQRYAEKLEAVDMAAVPEKPVELRENGVYVVTGGLGGIGLEVAKYLAARQKVRLMMINRT
ncbi:ketoacyl-synthetase-like protein, partial [Paenibacillus cellulosilyticus]